eukprot:COSAG06_NODE_20758_length_782_cov_1.635432_1_plen_117_part_10
MAKKNSRKNTLQVRTGFLRIKACPGVSSGRGANNASSMSLEEWHTLPATSAASTLLVRRWLHVWAAAWRWHACVRCEALLVRVNSAMVERLWSLYNARHKSSGHTFAPGERERVVKK